MVNWVRDKVYPTALLHISYQFIPLSGYTDRGYGTADIFLDTEKITSVRFKVSITSPKYEIDQMVLVMMTALQECKWLIVGRPLNFEDFETQMTPGCIGAFRLETPRNYEEW